MKQKKMYKILVIDASIQNIQIDSKIKYVKPEKAISELKDSEFDLIFITDKFKTSSLEKVMLADYMELPKGLKKLAIKNEVNHTYINLQIVNKLIFDNLEIIEFKDFYEKMTIALILKQFLIGETEVKKIYNNICPKELKLKYLKRTVDNVVKRNYVVNNLIRKCKYYICHKRIKTKFFKNILVNIESDINKMEKL